MPLDDDDADDDVGIGQPLPPDDRLWRHPSELAGLGGGAPTAVATPASGGGRSSLLLVALVAGLAGATLSGGILAVTGALDSQVERPVVEKVALTPVVSSPMLADEGGVTALAERMRTSMARLVVEAGEDTHWSSAVVYRDDGLLLASASDLVGATALTAVLADGRELDAEILGTDPTTDVAVVSIDADDLTVAILGSSEDLQVGEPTIALACSTKRDDPPSVVTGVISALEQRVDLPERSLHGMIQTDSAVEEAWSGGPLLDATGAVIGISSIGSGDHPGFGFATPIDLVRRIAEQIVVDGRAQHGWLGIDGVDLSTAAASRLGIDGGAVVRGVAAGSPAALAGLSEDDVITELGGEVVGSTSALVVALRDHDPGETITVAYWRDGAIHRTTMTVGTRP